MRKWKDTQPQQLKELAKASIIFLGFINSLVIFGIILSGQVTPSQIMGLSLGFLFIYLMLSGNFYRILKWFAERSIKKFDNKWR
jgi:hypothetical protein